MFVPQIHIRNKRTVFWKRDDPKRFVYLFAVIISRICRDSGQIDRDLFLCRLFGECKQRWIFRIDRTGVVSVDQHYACIVRQIILHTRHRLEEAYWAGCIEVDGCLPQVGKLLKDRCNCIRIFVIWTFVQAIVKRIMVVDTERIVDLRRTSGVTVGDADGCWQSWGSDISTAAVKFVSPFARGSSKI